MPQTVKVQLSIHVDPAFQVSTNTLPGGIVSSPYTAQVLASGGTPPYSFALGAGSTLPPGLTLLSDGTISGVPSSPGDFGFEVDASDSSK